MSRVASRVIGPHLRAGGRRGCAASGRRRTGRTGCGEPPARPRPRWWPP
ncbi:hypothetical protein [Ornithinimicrobium kibberense]